jgi:uncharacterized protein YacL
MDKEIKIALAAEKKQEGENPPDKPGSISFSPKLVALLADEVAKTVVKRLPKINRQNGKKKKKANKPKIENGIFLDTSAIIDGRIFDVIALGLLNGYFVILESILLELKHIADSQDMVKRERGRKGLEYLEKLKKEKEEAAKVKAEAKKKEQEELDKKFAAAQAAKSAVADKSETPNPKS